MKHKNTIYTLLAALIITVAGVFAIDSNSKKASVFNLPEFRGTTNVPEADEQAAPTVQDLNDAIVNIAEQTTPTVVTVRVTQTVEVPQNPFSRFFGRPQGEPEQRKRRGIGSGVIVSEDGYILTNNHVVEGASEIVVELKNGNSYDGEIVGRDPRTDIAVIKIDANNLEAIEIGNSDKARVGELVLAIGSPLGRNLQHSVSLGIISAKDRSIGILSKSKGYEKFIQTDAAINPGNSGGALVNMSGELVGINTAIASRSGGSDGIGFAVPSNLAKEVMKALIKNGEVVRAQLGIYGRDIDRTLARALGLDNSKGIIINSISEGTAADQAGLKEGDVIKTLNGEPIGSYTSFRTDIATSNPGEEVTLGIVRDGESMEVEVTLGKLDPEMTASTQDSSDDIHKDLGFRVDELTANIASQLDLAPGQEGVVVTNVNQGSNAAREGLRRGDVIIKVNKQPIESVSDFRNEIKKLADEEKPVVLLQVLTKGIKRYVAFEL